MILRQHISLALSALLIAAAPPVMAQQAEPVWAFEQSDLPVDPAYQFGQLDNAMRFIIRHNATPKGQAMVQMYVDAGSLSEDEDELGYAHFVEHMAFNGSRNVPEGEMIKLLEREGLAFGADTNASTNFEQTIYRLDLPRNDPALLDTALFLMRETASELSFSDDAVIRERGVVLSEKRVRDTFAWRNMLDGFDFLYRDARFTARMPIGTTQALEGADGARLRAFWARHYVPGNVTLIVIGDFDPALVEAKIRTAFSGWNGPAAMPAPDAGPIDPAQRGLTDIYLDPALSEQLSISLNGPYTHHPDTIANRQQDVLRQVGYGIVNRRLTRISRDDNPPFRNAGLGDSEVFKAGHTSNLVINAAEGEWQRGLAVAAQEYRRALAFGFTEAEVAEQLANLRNASENQVAGAATRDNGALLGAALELIASDRIPTTPQSGLDRLDAMAMMITPGNVLAALKAELIPLDNPLIRFEGRTPPAGGEAALRSAWQTAMAAPLAATSQEQLTAFGYEDFGPAGTVVADTVEPLLGIRTIRFANGVRLNLKPTDLQKDRVSLSFQLDGGDLLNTRADPLATAMAASLPLGGLGKHSLDELQTILAGRSVGFSFAATEAGFAMGVTTTPRDLELQLQLTAAMLADPGYRPQGEVQYRRNIANFFASKDATPPSALGNALGAIISDNDPRFTLQNQAAYEALNFARLRAAIGDRLEHGAVELALVGDFDPDLAIALVARSLGAIPPREPEFRAYTENRQRRFTADRALRTVPHDGPADQALLRKIWPTTDDSMAEENIRLGLLEAVTRLLLLDILREELGQTYSPAVEASQSHAYPGWGLFSIGAAITLTDLDATSAAMDRVIAQLRDAPVDPDTMLRARQPLIERFDNALKTNGGWMALAARAQSEPERLDRFVKARERIMAVTPHDLQQTALRYLGNPPLVIEVRPRG